MLEKFGFRRVHKPHLGLFYKAPAWQRVLLYLERFPQPLDCFCTNTSSQMSVSTAAGQGCLFSFCSSLSLSLSHTHTHINMIERRNFLNFGALERVPESTLSGYFPLLGWRKAGEAWEKRNHHSKRNGDGSTAKQIAANFTSVIQHPQDCL